jgi:ABC-type glycerol-3-phosphate transport system substrate-binding protein
MARATTKITPEGEWQVAGCNPHLVRCWLAANGGAEFDSYRAPTKCLYDTPQAIDALTFVGDLYTRWKVTPANVTAANSPLGANDINAFGLGKLTLNGRWGPPISQYRTQVTFTWGLVPYPKGRGPQGKMTNDFASGGTSISKRTKAPNLTWAWAKFTVDEEGQLLGVKQSGGTGMPFSKAAQDATIQELRTIPTLETPEMTVEMTRKGNGVVRLASVNQNEINAILNEELNKLWRGESAAPVAAREAAARVNRYLQDNPQ